MLHALQKLIVFAIVSHLVVITTGCQGPTFARGGAKEVGTSLESDLEPAPKGKAIESIAVADEATVASVMQEVQQIRTKNPEAAGLLLDELSSVEPKLWPLVLQQFRSRQALHEQLSSRPKAQASSRPEIEDVAFTPPSAEVGKLTDPRRVRNDAALEQAFAHTSPANMPAPIDPAPVERRLTAQAARAAFAGDVADSSATMQKHAGSDQAEVIQVFTGDSISTVATAGDLQQAIYTADANTVTRKEPRRNWQQYLDLTVGDLSERLSDGPRSTAEVHQLVSLRLLQLLAGQTEAALQPIPDVSAQEQDYWSGQIFALATFLDHHRQPDDERRAAASVVHLDEAVGHLRELGSLSLRNLAFCKHVYGYGAYEPINAPTFAPGQQLTIYLEVENYHSESTQKGFTTKLGASYEVVDDAGERVAGGDFPMVEDICQSRRRDFHIQYGLVLPKTAKAGKHHLKLVMDDRQSDKLGSASISFDVR